jgi:DNA-binding NarL/FixJ family response regulator
MTGKRRVFKKPPGNFTTQEVNIFWLIYDGLTNKQIAAKLNLSYYTVRDKVSVMLQKFGAKTRAELLSIILSQIVPPRPEPTDE